LFDNFQQTLHDNGTLPLVPPGLQVNKPRVLDCGYGTGAWIEDCLNSDSLDFDEDNDVSGHISVAAPGSEPCPGVADP
jgi:hypothetical protein